MSHLSASEANVEIPGVELLEVIGRGARSVVYRARRGERAVAVKLMELQGPQEHGDATGGFYREAALQARIPHPGLAAILEVGENRGRPYLVMEYLEGRTLATILEDGPMSERRALSIARGLAAVLAEIHRRGLVHRDLKPQNVIVDRNGIARIVDFGFATQMARDAQDHVGTFLYSAPEQSGMLKRPVDARSDLYALGAILFECASGRPPFECDDLAELLRLHVSTLPPRLSELAEVSPAVDAIVACLLAKEPEDRYQCADSLVADLDSLAALNSAMRVGGSVVLRSADDASAQAGVVPLIGRDAELNVLTALWTRAVGGRGAVAVIEGEAGIGKTRLLNELVSGARQAGALVVRGGSAAGEDVPLGPLRDIVEDAFRQIRRLPPLRRAAAEARLRSALSDYAPLLRRFTPSLAALLADDNRGLDLGEAHDLFYDALLELILRLADHHHALLIVLEDVHRVDDATGQFMRRLAADIERRKIFMVLSARDDAAAIIDALANDLGTALAARIRLSNLDGGQIARLLSAHVGAPLEDSLITRVVLWSDGNPLAAEELLEAILDDGSLRPHWGRWVIDVERLEHLTLPNDVAGLVARRANTVGPQTLAVMQVAAVAGMRIPAALLIDVCGDLEEAAVHAALDEAQRLRLIERDTRDIRGYTDPAQGGSYRDQVWRFVHERVRDALLEEVEAGHRKRLHRTIARALQKVSSEPRFVYDVARHYALGEIDDPSRVYEASLKAGLAAVNEYADEDAIRYLEQARRAAESGGIAVGRPLLEAYGGVCYRTGRLDEATAHFRDALAAASSPQERAWLHGRLAQVELARFDSQAAMREVERAFAEMGEPFGGSALLSTAATAVGVTLKRRRGAAAQAVDDDGSANAKRLVWLYEIAGHAAYYEVQPRLLLDIAVRSLAAATRLGPSREKVRGLCNHIIVLALAGRNAATDSVIEEACGLADGLFDPMLIGHTRLYRTMAWHILGRTRRAEQEGRATLLQWGRWLDAAEFYNACTDLSLNLFGRGHFEEAWKWVQHGLQRAQSGTGEAFRRGQVLLMPIAASLQALLGHAHEGLKFLDASWEVVGRDVHGVYRHSLTLQHQALFHLEQGELGTPMDDVLERHDKLGIAPLFMPFHLRLGFVIFAYVRLAQCLEAPTDGPRREAFRRALGALRKTQAPPALACHQHILQAHLAALAGDEAPSTHLSAAEQLAAQCDSIWGQLEVASFTASLHLKHGWTDAARREAQHAVSLATQMGWRSRVRKLREKFGLNDQAVTTTRLSLGSKPSGSSEAARLQRHLDALLEVSLAWSSVFDAEELSRRALDEIVRILGAERGFLFVCGEEEDAPLTFKASRDMNGVDLGEVTGYSHTVVEEVRTSGRPVLISGSEQGSRLGAKSVMLHDLRSILAAPLHLRERLAGVVYVDNHLARGLFGEEDVGILQALGNHIAIGLETARAARREIVFETERKQRALAETLSELSRGLASTLELDEVFERLLDCVQKLVPFDVGQGLLVADQDLLIVADFLVGQPDMAKGSRRGRGETALLEEVLDGGEARLVQGSAASSCGLAGLDSWLGVPLCVKGTAVGVLSLGRQGGTPFTEREAELSLAFAGQAAFAVENARLFGEVQHMAVTDALTQLHNRGAFMRTATHAVRHAREKSLQLSVLMLDVDFFKRFNDTYGHALGDRVLVGVAAAVRAGLRSGDTAGRYGGEEFVVLLPDLDLDEAAAVAEALRERVAATVIPSDSGAALSVSVSIGVAALVSDDAGLASILKRADDALYAAKEAGRNRVVRAAGPSRVT